MTWLTDDKNRRAVIMALACMAFLISLVFLNRWFIAEKGIYSFGRLWHYYISYADFGFTKRALFGTLLTELGLNKIVANEYVFTYLIYTLKLALLTSLILYFCLRAVPFDNPVGYAVVFLSPAFILHSAYTSGSQDLQLLILMTVLILFVRRDVTLVVLSCVGVLMHELFIFLLPAIFLLHTYRSAPEWQITKRKIAHAVLPALPVIMTIMAVLSFGRIDIREDTFQQMMVEKLPNAAHKHSWWSGHDELSYSLQDDKKRSVVRSLPGAIGYIAIPVAYILSLALVLAFYLRESSFF